MDYLSLKAACHEASQALRGARVASVRARGRDALALGFGRGGTLLLSIAAERPGLFLARGPWGDGTTTSFSDLTEASLRSADLLGVDLAEDGERVVLLRFAARWPHRAGRERRLALEVMGRHSNLILLDEEGRVVGAMKEVPPSRSRVRPILPGVTWSPPPARPGIPLEEAAAGDVVPIPGGRVDAASLVSAVRGLSPWTAAQALARGGAAGLTAALSAFDREADGQTGFLVRQEGRTVLSPFAPAGCAPEAVRRFEPFSLAAWTWLQEGDRHDAAPSSGRSETESLAGRLAERRRAVPGLLDRQDAEEARCRGHAAVRLQAEAVLSSLGAIPRGSARASLPHPGGGPDTVQVELDPSLPPAANADRLFTLARRMARGLEEVEKRRGALRASLEAIDLADERLLEGDAASALELLRPRRAAASRRAAAGRRSPGRLHEREGFSILVGRGARDNERVTFEAAGPEDLWLHARDYPGTHVVVLSGRRSVPDSVVAFAARLAAEGSGARGESAPEVMVTERKWVRRLKGGRPGQVTVERFRTIRVRGEDQRGGKT